MRLLLTTAIIFAGLTGQHAFAQAPNDFLRTNPRFLASFADVVRKASAATVRIQCDGKDASLGAIVADGWVLTKAHDLRGPITCVLRDGQKVEAKLIGVHESEDLAMLKLPVRTPNIVTFTPSDAVLPGAWVASVGIGNEPVAVGVVGAATRKVYEAYLGVLVDSSPKGPIVINIAQKSAAFKAGLLPKDILLQIDNRKVVDSDSVLEFLGERRPGETIVLRIRRGEKEQDIKVKLQSRDQVGDFRTEFQNRLGSDLSTRRGGYAVVLQHDSIIKPSDCGGPLVDLKGRVVGLNISRAGRVETLAIPSEVIRPLIAELQSGRLAPKERPKD